MRPTPLLWGLVVALAAAVGCWRTGQASAIMLVFALAMGAVGAPASSLVASLRQPALRDRADGRPRGDDQVRDQGHTRGSDVG